MTLRERLAMAAVYSLVFVVLSTAIEYAKYREEVRLSQSAREPSPPVPVVLGGLALHSEAEDAP